MQGERLEDIRGVLFDLDGTLLQVEMHQFIPAYLEGLAACFPPTIDARVFAREVVSATLALIRCEVAGRTNEEIFLAGIEARLGIGPELFCRGLERFCSDGLQDLSPLVRPLPLARDILASCFGRDLKVALATNPVFHRAVVDARVRWGNLHDFEFHCVTSLENTRHCKPNPRYFIDLLEELELAPSECVMVGNDPLHDLAARQVGIATFLVETFEVERPGRKRFEADFRGGHGDLLEFVGRLGAATDN